MREEPSFFAIIPAFIRYDKKLSEGEKLLYGEISALANSTGRCWANNAYFSELYGKSPSTISRWINNLVRAGYIKSIIERDSVTKQVKNRYLSLIPLYAEMPIGMSKNAHSPIGKNAQDNNTSINNIINNNAGTELNSQVVDIIDGFTKINPSASTFYGWKSQRDACLDLIKTYSYESVKKVVWEVLPITNVQPYFSPINTPKQLFYGWSKLKQKIEQAQNSSVPQVVW